MARAALYAYERDPVDLRLRHGCSTTIEAVPPDVGAAAASSTSVAGPAGTSPRCATVTRASRPSGSTSPPAWPATLDTGTPAAVADAMQLPIRSASCDVAIAAHMLYHVPDIALAASPSSPASSTLRVSSRSSPTVAITCASSTSSRATHSWRDRLAVDGTGRSAARFLLDDAAALVAPALTVVGVERISKRDRRSRPGTDRRVRRERGVALRPGAPERSRLGRRAPRGRRASSRRSSSATAHSSSTPTSACSSAERVDRRPVGRRD